MSMRLFKTIHLKRHLICQTLSSLLLDLFSYPDPHPQLRMDYITLPLRYQNSFWASAILSARDVTIRVHYVTCGTLRH